MSFLLPVLLLADYFLPAAEETHIVIVAEWRIEKSELHIGSRTYSIDLFWLADRHDSNSICCGDHEGSMRKRIQGLIRRKGPLRVELVAKQMGDRLFVAGLWPYQSDQAFAKASKEGSPLLRIDASAVRMLGAKGYLAALVRRGAYLDKRRDLKLKLAFRGTRRPPVAVIENASGKDPHRVVLPGDGSPHGRAPAVRYTVWTRVEGCKQGPWTVVKPRAFLRCGTFNPHRDTVLLAPAESATLSVLPSLHAYRFIPGRRYRLRLHYVQGSLELVSNSVEFDAPGAPDPSAR